MPTLVGLLIITSHRLQTEACHSSTDTSSIPTSGPDSGEKSRHPHRDSVHTEVSLPACYPGRQDAVAPTSFGCLVGQLWAVEAASFRARPERNGLRTPSHQPPSATGIDARQAHPRPRPQSRDNTESEPACPVLRRSREPRSICPPTPSGVLAHPTLSRVFVPGPRQLRSPRLPCHPDRLRARHSGRQCPCRTRTPAVVGARELRNTRSRDCSMLRGQPAAASTPRRQRLTHGAELRVPRLNLTWGCVDPPTRHHLSRVWSDCTDPGARNQLKSTRCLSTMLVRNSQSPPSHACRH